MLFDWPLRNIYILQIQSGTYVCLFLGKMVRMASFNRFYAKGDGMTEIPERESARIQRRR